ncbi:hypothetical protein GCM10022225_06240 [Plantactinospora mayteni]|uniref:Uncharacterized protein n=1 Tax=Plantactinospora mayteni TaxID=566021 RepID=A0ABQ4ER66_9ACTN|nr:hypothetical protein [Plantactinospora mayteni]GIG97114.1 hypothetical protein Pma05_36870 [Plantactinospora mayteni]
MHPSTVDRDSRLSFWRRVREFAVPLPMIELATARRTLGDWAGACAAARVDIDLRPRSVARTYGRELADRLRADLRHLAPDLLRWHLPRVAPDGLLRPGLTISLARYPGTDAGTPHLVARTAPAWADAGQRISLALWDPARPAEPAGPHPHPRPDRRFRLDLHRHLWDVRQAGELRVRSGAERQPGAGRLDTGRPEQPASRRQAVSSSQWPVPDGFDCAVQRWAAEAELLLDADGSSGHTATVRLGSRHRLLLDLVPDPGGGPVGLRIRAAPVRDHPSGLPVLPDAATWILPDLALLRAGLIGADGLHPLVASALVPDRPVAETRPDPTDGPGPRYVECRGVRHRIGVLDGTLVALDHDPAEIRREELLAALTGTPLPCLLAIDGAHRQPENLGDIRARLDHGDTDGAVATVERLLGPDALLRGGALWDELETAALRRVSHGLYRAGLGASAPHPASGLDGYRRELSRRVARPSGTSRAHPRHASAR